MCGICGVVFFDERREADPHLLRTMNQTLVHRGPDDEGYVIDGPAALAARRLSIIDLTTGHQPIGNEDGSIWAALNGEIYNHQDVRQELEGRGHVFRTRCDTEVITHAYEEWGEDCVQRFNGMFAFAVWDGRRRVLLLVRDRLGVKPLYYALTSEGILFGSELKAILAHPSAPREVDFAALDAFLTFEYIPAPLTIFHGVRKLPAGHLLRLEKGQAMIRQYWDVPVGEMPASEQEYEERLRSLLADAVRLRLISDVPLGAFLSGGVDSSIIVGLMAGHTNGPVKTFSIGFDDPSYNELAYARAVAQHFHTEHREFTIQPDIVDLSERLITHFDEPFADSSMFSTFLVSQVTREHVTVALSGDGGDELFAGYDHYLAGKADQWYRRLPSVLRRRVFPELVRWLSPSTKKKGAVNKLKRFVEGAAGPDELGHLRWITFLTAADREQLYTSALHEQIVTLEPTQYVTGHFTRARDAAPLAQQMYVDLKTYLVDDILVKVDRMSMANSLEVRTPFLDYRVVELAARMPAHLKLRGWERKYILKRAMSSLLPPEVVNRKKEGFSVPLKNWLRGSLREMMQDVLSTDALKRQGWFQPQYVQRLVHEHLTGQANHGHQLWSLMVLELWDRQPYAVTSCSSAVPRAAAL